MNRQYESKEYIEHIVFKQIAEYIQFYNSLSFSMMNWVTGGTRSVYFETYIFSSLKGTLESINATLGIGCINDSFALLRKYFDGIIIHSYASLYLQDKFLVEEIIVERIDNWISGKQNIPDYREMSSYIRKSEKMKPTNAIIYADDKYRQIRSRCNSHVHYNFFRFMFLNDNQVYNEKRIEYLNALSDDLLQLFIMHFVNTFMINEHYMMASDYIDHLEVGGTPEEGSQYWVAPFIQDAFTNVIQKYRPDIAIAFKENIAMQLI